MGLSFTIAAGSRQKIDSWVWVPRDSWPYFTVSDSLPPSSTWRARSPYFISLRIRVAHLYPQALCSLFVASYESQGYGGDIRTSLHTRLPATAKWPFLYLDTDRTENTAPVAVELLPWKHAGFLSSYLTTGVVLFLTSRSLLSNWSTCHNMLPILLFHWTFCTVPFLLWPRI
jgi:hypothetical protein